MSRIFMSGPELSLKKTDDTELTSEKELDPVTASEVAVDGGLRGWMGVAGWYVYPCF